MMINEGSTKIVHFMSRGTGVPLPLLMFICSMIILLICKHEPSWQEVSVDSLILRWSLRPVDLLSKPFLLISRLKFINKTEGLKTFRFFTTIASNYTSKINQSAESRALKFMHHNFLTDLHSIGPVHFMVEAKRWLPWQHPLPPKWCIKWVMTNRLIDISKSQ